MPAIDLTPHSDEKGVSHHRQIHTVNVPDTVCSSGIVPPEIIAEAVTYLHRDGIIVLDNAIDVSHLDTLREILEPEAEVIAQDPSHHFNFGQETRNMDQAPPLVPEIMFSDVWANPIACTILQAILGPELVCHYANGNTALKATGRQPVHSDIGKPHPMFPFAYIINISLSDVSPENGATEIWLGSHIDSCVDQHVSHGGEDSLPIEPKLVEQRANHSPPIQPTTKKGSLIIRDVRLWHAGMPNRTDSPRIMLAFVVQPKWFQAPSKVLLPLKARHVVEAWKSKTGLEYNAQWVDGEVDHKKVFSGDVDFSTTNVKLQELEHLMHSSQGNFPR